MFLNSVQTVTLNSALSQNWVGCTVRTPRTQVARTLRAQCPCRGRCCAHSKLVVRMSRACRTRSQRRSRACWECTCRDTPRQPAPGSRPHFDVATSRQPASCRDIKSVSRHHPDHSMSRHQIGVATSFLCPHRCPCRDIKMMSRPQA